MHLFFVGVVLKTATICSSLALSQSRFGAISVINTTLLGLREAGRKTSTGCLGVSKASPFVQWQSVHHQICIQTGHIFVQPSKHILIVFYFSSSIMAVLSDGDRVVPILTDLGSESVPRFIVSLSSPTG